MLSGNGNGDRDNRPKNEAEVSKPEQQGNENDKLKLSVHAEMPLGHVGSEQGQILKEHQVRIRQSLEAVHRQLAELNKRMGIDNMPASKALNEAVGIFQTARIDIHLLKDVIQPGIDQIHNSANHMLEEYLVRNKALTQAQVKAELVQLQTAVGKKLENMDKPATQANQEQTSSNSTPRNR